MKKKKSPTINFELLSERRYGDDVTRKYRCGGYKIRITKSDKTVEAEASSDNCSYPNFIYIINSDEETIFQLQFLTNVINGGKLSEHFEGIEKACEIKEALDKNIINLI